MFSDRGPRMAWNGSRLRRVRHLKGLTQKKVAELTHPISEQMGLKERVTYKMISDYELNKEQPRADTLAVICKALDMDPKYPLELSDHAPLIVLSDAEFAAIIKGRGGTVSATDHFIDETTAHGGFGD